MIRFLSKNRIAAPSILASLGLGAYSYHRFYNSEAECNVVPTAFKPFKVLSITPETHDTSRFLIQGHIPKNEPILSRLLTHVIVKDDSCQIARSYTPIRYMDESGRDVTGDEPRNSSFELLVKRYPNGSISRLIHACKEGDTLLLRGPIPSVSESERNDILNAKRLNLIAGGTGIAPFYPLMKYLLSNKPDVSIHLILANKTEDDILLSRELNALSQEYPSRLSIQHVLETYDSSWKHGKGRIGVDVLQKHLSPPRGDESIVTMVCGPDGMVESMVGSLSKSKQQKSISGYLGRLEYPRHKIILFE